MFHYLALGACSVAKVGGNLTASLLPDLVKMSGNFKMDLKFLITIFIWKYRRHIAEQTLPVRSILALSA